MNTLKKNDRISVKITDWTEKGLAKGTYKSIDIIVPFTVPGDIVLAHITKVTSTMAYGKLLDFSTRSPNRASAPCAVFGQCGGCQLQHMSYETQLDYKKTLVQAAFQKGGLSHPPLIIDSTDAPYAYRNKSQFSISRMDTGRTLIGLSAPRSQRIIDCKSCDIQHPLTNLALDIVRRHLRKRALPVSHLVTRVGVNTQELMVALVSSQKTMPELKELITELRTIPELKSVYLSHNTNPEWVVLGDSETLLWGSPTINETVAGLTLSLSLRSFFQANTYQIEPLWTKISDLMALKKTDVIWDLYSGTGSLSIYLAQKAKYLIGIESHPEAIKNAKKNALVNSISNTKFIEGDVEAILPTLQDPCDGVIVDPPRKGLTPTIIKSLLELDPPKLLYVSCSPESLVRDLKGLCSNGYQIKAVELVDLFPQTYHVETLVMLERIERT
ncbi:23S rRNA (uracil(1939)-C(5))-methyltransferase RlmD [bacterium]|jgi:23S rRNA (uracil1939-C5)-methyltransferase|nr:23S rRNA (uracil(1939)-C(5))-methyltransferase RlmD [bacterium]